MDRDWQILFILSVHPKPIFSFTVEERKGNVSLPFFLPSIHHSVPPLFLHVHHFTVFFQSPSLFSPLLLISVLDQIYSILPSVPPSTTCCQLLIIIFLISLAQFIIFWLGMWSACQVREPSPSSSFLEICLPIWEPSHPMLAKECVCVFVLCSFKFSVCLSL